MRTHIFAIDPGIANTGICYVNKDRMQEPKIKTIKTDNSEMLVDRIIFITKGIFEFLKTIEAKDNDKIIIVIEDYIIRTTSSKHQEKTIKLIGVLEYELKPTKMLRPGSTGWQSKIKKEFNEILKLKGKGWNAHTRDAYAMCCYAKKHLLGGKK